MIFVFDVMRSSTMLCNRRLVTSLLHHTRLLSTGVQPRPRALCHRNDERHVTSSLRQRSVRMRCYSTVVSSPYPDLDANVIDAPITSLAHFVINECRKYSRQTALVDGESDRQISFAELETMVAKVSSSLIRHGLISKGSVVTIFSPNCVEYVIIYLAMAAAGAVISTVNPAYNTNELTHAVNLVKSTLLVTAPSLLPVVNQARLLCPRLKEIVVFGDGHEGCRPFSSLLDDDMSYFPENIDINVSDDVVSLPFSSGTTGLPKGVMLTHRNLHVNVEQARSSYTLGLQPGADCFVTVLPLFHIYGQVVSMLTGLASGAVNVMLPKFDPKIYLECVQKYKATYLMVAPPIMLFLAQHPLVTQTDMSSVRSVLSGAAPIRSSTLDLVYAHINRSNIDIRQGYGMTETSPLTHVQPEGGYKVDTVGPAVQNTRFKIIDPESGQTVPVGQSGEICTYGPQVMKGYYNNDKATKETIDDEGWLHSGDFGRADEDGHLLIEDRVKELIKVKGFQVAPAELEALLVSHEDVQDAAVIGRDDERAGELPTAFVVLKPHRDTSEKKLQQFVADRVAPFKRLTGGVVFCDEIPKAASGKILRRVLRSQLK